MRSVRGRVQRISDGRVVNVPFSITPGAQESVRDSVRAYQEAYALACLDFFATYLAPNDLHALAQFNQLVSGYRLGKEEALLVRRPRVLSLDEQGRLHSATGKCIEYHDG